MAAIDQLDVFEHGWIRPFLEVLAVFLPDLQLSAYSGRNGAWRMKSEPLRGGGLRAEGERRIFFCFSAMRTACDHLTRRLGCSDAASQAHRRHAAQRHLGVLDTCGRSGGRQRLQVFQGNRGAVAGNNCTSLVIRPDSGGVAPAARTNPLVSIQLFFAVSANHRLPPA